MRRAYSVLSVSQLTAPAPAHMANFVWNEEYRMLVRSSLLLPSTQILSLGSKANSHLDSGPVRAMNDMRK